MRKHAMNHSTRYWVWVLVGPAMTKLLRKIETLFPGSDPVQRLDRAAIQSRADTVARDLLHTTRDDAFGRLQRGELKGTLAEPELRMLHDMLATTR